MSSERLDIIIFGATGFTGNFIIEAVTKISELKDRNLSFGIAGRSKNKLEETLKKVSARSAIVLPEKVPIIIADVNDEKSLREMAKKAKVIVNACGPYWLLGEPVVKACIEEGTHHVDISGEQGYMELIELNYHEEAKKKNVYIVSACGATDSILAELGVLFLEDNFPGTLNSVEIYLTAKLTQENRKGPLVNIGTFKSVVEFLSNQSKVNSIHSKLFPTELPDFEPKLKTKYLPHSKQHVEGISVPFLASPDLCSLYRSQRYFYEHKKKRPIQTNIYFAFDGYWALFLVIFFAPILFLLSQFEMGRNLLLKHPDYFTYGVFSNEEPSLETVENLESTCTYFGEGWKEKLNDPNDQYTNPTDQKIVGTIKCKNPGYGATAMCIALCAKVILTETEKLPNKGGVYPPGAAFADTSLIDHLKSTNTFTFDLLSIPTNVVLK